VNTLVTLYPLSIFAGLFSNIAAPAHQAMVADILPEEKRSEGFGILRVAGNLSWLIGPTIGGFLATQPLPIGSIINEFLTTHPFFLLFVTDVVISCGAAILFYLYIPETKFMPLVKEKQENILEIFTGYFRVLQDGSFMAFVLAAILMDLVYLQMYNSLSVYLRDNHGIDPQGYGFLMSASAITVILFQLWISSVIKRHPPFLMLALGTLFYMLGFSMFGLVSFYWLFILAVVVITFGEMLVMPTSQVLTAHFAPEEMRGRYMAVFSLVWMIPSIFGPGLAGIVLDNYNPNLLWYIGGALCAGSALSFYALHLKLGNQERFAPARVETGQIAGSN
jgi:MFS family permease